MTERGLPSIDSPVACPFVAFADDRDERATSPDHRHRCYAEATPAPRALAHQEAYCLASAFPICPTFQDWARREAARTRTESPTTAGMPIPGLSDDGPAADLEDVEEPPYEDRPRRSNQHDWAAPPPWLNPSESARAASRDAGAAAESTEDAAMTGGASAGAAGGAAAGGAVAGGAAASAGLSGSFADRLVTNEPTSRQRTPVWRDDDRWDDEAHDEPAAAEAPEDAVGDDSAVVAAAAASAAAARAEIEDSPPRRNRERSQAPGRDRDDLGRHDVGPSWERPARLEAFPSLRSQRMPSINLPTLAVAAIAVVVAAILLFFLPSLLGIGSNQPGGSPSPSVAASVAAASLAPTLVPEPTQQTYAVQNGDTMSKIAKKFGVPLQVLIDANKTTIPNPDKLKIGDTVIIPGATPSTVPAASP